MAENVAPRTVQEQYDNARDIYLALCADDDAPQDDKVAAYAAMMQAKMELRAFDVV